MPREQRSAKSQCSPSLREAVNVETKSVIRKELMLCRGVVGDCRRLAVRDWSNPGVIDRIAARRDSTGFMSDGR